MDKTDKFFQETLTKRSDEVSEFAWEKIEAKLRPQRKNKIYIRIALVAGVTLLLGGSAFYFSPESKEPAELVQITDTIYQPEQIVATNMADSVASLSDNTSIEISHPEIVTDVSKTTKNEKPVNEVVKSTSTNMFTDQVDFAAITADTISDKITLAAHKRKPITINVYIKRNPKKVKPEKQTIEPQIAVVEKTEKKGLFTKLRRNQSGKAKSKFNEELDNALVTLGFKRYTNEK